MTAATMFPSTGKGAASSAAQAKVAILYCVFLLGACLVYHLVANGEFSSVLTLSAMFQCLAFMLLAMQALYRGSVEGISAHSLALDAMALACRLSSTLWLNGYLPVDATGDFIYQAADLISLTIVGWLLHRVLIVKRSTYEAEQDALSALPFAAGSLFVASLSHANLNDRPLFDMLWMAGLLVSSVAVLPQLFLMMRSGSPIQPLTSHFIAVMGISRLLSGMYMWMAHEEISCETYISNFNHAGWTIIGAHAVHLVLLADFAYYYGKTVALHGLNSYMELPVASSPIRV